MSATQFTVDERDVRFVLHEQLNVIDTLASFPRFADFDMEFADSLLEEAWRMATEVLAPINAKGDQEGVGFDGNGNVSTPEGFKEAWDQLAEGGWLSLTAPADHGGVGAPQALGMAVSEAVSGANCSFGIYSGLTVAAANLLLEFSPSPWGPVAVEKMLTGEWAGTMCLTEAGAGTSVGDVRTRATPEGDGYLLEGEKVFISSGDHDLTENIVHLVLARLPDAPNGTKGLSLFLVPKFLFDQEGGLGERNGVMVAGIEEKLGIHASATCTITLGADQPCVGYLVGEPNKGMEIMFHMMNEARIGVGIQGLAGASAAYNYARAYAMERVQGTDLDQMRNPEAQPVPINQHPDVRRMLMHMKVSVETMRSLLFATALRLDRAIATEDEEESKNLHGLVELMTPICKAHCSDLGFEVSELAIQTFGGYGYIQEYPVEQVLRDTKIFSLYEGTNGVQAMDLLGRKMRMQGGGLFMAWLNECNEEIERCKTAGCLEGEVTAMEKARDSLGGAAMHLGGLGMQGNIRGAMLQATPFLRQFGTVVLGLHAMWQGRIAAARLEAGELSAEDEAFYKGKVLNAKFYCANILPRATAYGKSITSNDESCLDPSLFA